MGNKSKKAKKKLAARQKGWEDMGGAQVSPGVKKSGDSTFHKPGSLNPKK